MNDQSSPDAHTQYASVLATLTHESEGCSDDPLHPHSLDTEAFETELVHMDDLTIVTSNGELSGRLTSRILSGGLGAISNSKSEELLQPNCQVSDHSLIFKTSNPNSKLTKWKERHIVKKDSSTSPIYPKSSDSTQTNMLNTSGYSNNEINNIILSVNKLPQQSTNNTAVEQPNIGPCSCFICGQVLSDPGERFTYLKSQKLFSMKISLLELLSNIVNQTVMTDTEAIDLCQRCSELMNEADITCKHLYDLREEINKLFTINKRPKLTFHILPKPPSPQLSKDYVLKNSSYVSLSDLACSRPRRGRSKKSSGIRNKKVNILENEKREKKKGGRPRKPFQCHVCRRKFLTLSLVDKHMFKEHNITPSNAVEDPTDSLTASTTFGVSKNSVTKVKVEIYEDEADSETKSQQLYHSTDQEISISKSFLEADSETKSQQLYHSTDQETSISKSFLMENLVAGIQSPVRPIQPKPQTLVQTAVDGSLIYVINPTTGEAAPSLIKISPGYLNLKTENHTCELCQKTFLDDKGYKMHKIAAHGIRKKKSDSEINGNEGAIINEDKKDGIQKLWHCDMCNLVFLSRKLLADHKKQSHENIFKDLSLKEQKKDKLYACNDCDQIFNYKYEMEKHRESHLPFHKVGPHEFLCCICGLKVASKAALKIHIHRFHIKDSETKDFLCAECGYMTGTKKSFTDHLKIHTDNPGQKKVCHICKKEMLPSSFKIHMVRMHGEAKYPCEICGQRFTLRSVLMKHLNTIHSSLRPYDCVLCSEKFVTAEALRYHKNKVHSTVFYFCEVCGKNFKWKGELRTHMNRMHNDTRVRHQCSTCTKSYADKRKLFQHMINKHNAVKGSPILDKKQNEGDVSKVHEIVSSSYNPPDTSMLSSPPTVPSSMPVSCSSSYAGVHLLSDDNLTSLNEYGDEQSTLTTLHSHVPLHQDLDTDQSHTQVTTLTHYDTSIHHVSTHEVLTQQSLSTGLLTHEKAQHSSHHEVQSIYLVSDIPLNTTDKIS